MKQKRQYLMLPTANILKRSDYQRHTDSQSSNDYYPFGSTMAGRGFSQGTYRFGFNGQEKDDEIYGNGNTYYYGRFLDPRIGRWLLCDKLVGYSASSSTYAYAGNSPILYIDIDGYFKWPTPSEESAQANANGLTVEQLQRFKNIVQNISKIVEGNEQALMAISNTTGYSRDKILKELQFGEGPSLTFIAGDGCFAGPDNIGFSTEMIKYLDQIDEADIELLSQAVLGVALTLLHEYGHVGDKNTNFNHREGVGRNTGQWYRGPDRRRHYDAEERGTRLSENSKNGLQKPWYESPTGHRGKDIEIIGYGVIVQISNIGKITIVKASQSDVGIPLPDTKVPDKLPENMLSGKILETLHVK